MVAAVVAQAAVPFKKRAIHLKIFEVYRTFLLYFTAFVPISIL